MESIMKSIMSFLTLVLASQLSYSHTLPEGTYQGQGIWKSASEGGNYTNTTVISKDQIKTHYKLTDGSYLDWDFTLSNETNNFFDITIEGQKVGTGYCLEKISLCHYQIEVSGVKLEESLVQQENNMYRYGSKVINEKTIFWQERLEK